MLSFDDNRFIFRLYGKIHKPTRPPEQPWSFVDYFAKCMVLPHSLLCGAMAIAGMILLSGIPWLAIAAGISSFAITYLRFGQYAPQLFRKIPFTLFKEIDEEGFRKNQYIQEHKRLVLILLYVFILTPLSALIITFFSLSLMNNAFTFLGIARAMSFNGFSTIPALSFFGLACFLCTWSMFSDGASNSFARKDFWPHLHTSAKKLLCYEPDPSLLLRGETQNTVGTRLLTRQILRLLLVLAALALIGFGNYVVGISGAHYMLDILKITSAPWEVSEIILPGIMLIGSASFIVGATNHLITTLILSAKFLINQVQQPIEITFKITNKLSSFSRGMCIFAAILCAPIILVIRAIIYLAHIEYQHLKNTVRSSYHPTSENATLFQDTNTVFDNLRCNTNYLLVNFSVNTLLVIPVTFVIGIGIFFSQHVKLFATVNAINTGAMAYNSHIPMVNNYLGMTGYLISSLNFGYRDIEPNYSISKYNPNENIKTILFKFSDKVPSQVRNESHNLPGFSRRNTVHAQT